MHGNQSIESRPYEDPPGGDTQRAWVKAKGSPAGRSKDRPSLPRPNRPAGKGPQIEYEQSTGPLSLRPRAPSYEQPGQPRESCHARE